MLKQPGTKLTLIFRLLALAFLVGLLRGCLLRPATDDPGYTFNQHRNALWLGVEWVENSHNKEEIEALARDLQRREIQILFVYAGYYKTDGTFTDSCRHAATFISDLEAAAPGLEIQAWIGLPLETTDLNDPAVRQEIVRFALARIREDGFAGIHLDPEPIQNGDATVLTLLDELRTALGPAPRLSFAGRRIQPFLPEIPLPVLGHWTWSAPYYREIAARTDQIAAMIYDSALPWAPLYRHWTRFQVIDLSRALQGSDTALFIGIPTSEEATFTHRPAAETMGSGLAGTIEGLNDAAAYPEVVTGVAIYPAWETDEQEWDIYEKLWLTPPPEP